MRTRLLVAAIAVFGVWGVPSSSSAQVGPDVAEPWEDARAFYRDGDYEQASRYIIEAIQRAPREPRYYLGLARAQNWLGNFDQAVFYYDIYLNDLAAELPPNLDRRDRVDAVREERDSANAQRDDRDAPLVIPGGQDAARAALDDRIAQGPGMTATGGGAYALYQNLLRTGYARPDLGDLRRRLGQRLIGEVRADIGERVARMPLLAYPAWGVHEDRLDAWQTLEIDDAVEASRVAALRAFVAGQRLYLNENAVQALEQFDSAIAADAQLVPAYVGRLSACLEASVGCGSDGPRFLAEALDIVDRLDPARLEWLAVFEAAFAARAGDDAAAADALLEVLAP